jgi:hypothetical protein
MSTREMIARHVQLQLAAPFQPKAIKWKPGRVSGNRAQAIAYIDARMVEDRLDEVLGIDGWKDSYEALAEGVICKLSIRLPGTDEWVERWDVGGESGQPDAGDRIKAAFSDALKRAAVKFGVGRYLYTLPSEWVDYDPQKKQLKSTPRLPGYAIPASDSQAERPATANPQKADTPRQEVKAKRPDPKTGTELAVWLEEFDKAALASGWFTTRELSRLVIAQVREVHKDLPSVMGDWHAAAITVAVAFARKLWADRKGLAPIDQIKAMIGHELERIEMSWQDFSDYYGDAMDNWKEADWKKALDRLKDLAPPKG